MWPTAFNKPHVVRQWSPTSLAIGRIIKNRFFCSFLWRRYFAPLDIAGVLVRHRVYDLNSPSPISTAIIFHSDHCLLTTRHCLATQAFFVAWLSKYCTVGSSKTVQPTVYFCFLLSVKNERCLITAVYTYVHWIRGCTDGISSLYINNPPPFL